MAAACPHPPLLIPEATGAPGAGDGELARLRAACDQAVAALLAGHPDLIVVVGADPKTTLRAVEYPPDVQAETVAVPSKAKAPQPAAVSLACNAVLPIAVRTFIEPPHAPFPPTPAAENRHRKETRGLPDRLPASAEGNRR